MTMNDDNADKKEPKLLPIDEAAKQAGIEVFRDMPIAGQRGVKQVAKLIGLARQLETAVQHERQEASERFERMSVQIAALSGRLTKIEHENGVLRRENDAYRLREQVGAELKRMKLPEQDARALLGFLSPPGREQGGAPRPPERVEHRPAPGAGFDEGDDDDAAAPVPATAPRRGR